MEPRCSTNAGVRSAVKQRRDEESRSAPIPAFPTSFLCPGSAVLPLTARGKVADDRRLRGSLRLASLSLTRHSTRCLVGYSSRDGQFVRLSRPTKAPQRHL